MKERPILFSGAMVRAILDGRKTQTRRMVKGQIAADPRPMMLMRKRAWDGAQFQNAEISKGYGDIGDRLWVRETFCDDWEATGGVRFRADGDLPIEMFDAGCKWRPSIFMPRKHCRIDLEIIGVRVERLQDISAEDCLAEGIDEHKMQELLSKNSAAFKTVPEHWIGGSDEGLSYCRACGLKEIDRLTAESPNDEFTLDGGWRSESDSQAFCETCHHALDNSLTDFGCAQELEHFESNGFDIHSASDCYALTTMLSCQGLGESKVSARLQRLSYRALWDSINFKRAPWSSNPWVWVVEFNRVWPL